MSLKTELKNFLEHYGFEETLDILEEISKENENYYPIKIIKSNETNE